MAGEFGSVNITVSPAQHKFIASTANVKGLTGGRGSGKSVAGALNLLVRANADGPRHYIASAPTADDLRKTVFMRLLEYGKKLGWIADEKHGNPPELTLKNGATIWCMSGHEPERFRGPDVSGWWADEFSLYSEEVYQTAVATLREGGRLGWIAGTFTPRGQNWTWRVFHDRPESELVTASTYDNPFNDPTFADMLRSQYTEERARQEIYGEFLDTPGNKFKRAWFRHYRRNVDKYLLDDAIVPIQLCSRWIFCDTAASSEEGIPRTHAVLLPGESRPVRKYNKPSWTVYQAWDAAPAGDLVLADQWRARAEVPELITALRAFIDRHNPVGCWIETRGPSGVAIYQLAKREGLPVGALDPKGMPKDDWSRIGALQVAMEAGRVWFPQTAPWRSDLEDELLYFPNADNDDQVDCAAYMATKMRSMRGDCGAIRAPSVRAASVAMPSGMSGPALAGPRTRRPGDGWVGPVKLRRR